MKKLITILCVVLWLLGARVGFLLGQHSATEKAQELYNAKIESYIPYDNTKHKTANYRLLAKG